MYSDSKLPPRIDHFYSLFALDIAQKTSSTFKYPSWIFKVLSNKDGRTYALRRIEGNAESAASTQAIGLTRYRLPPYK